MDFSFKKYVSAEGQKSPLQGARKGGTRREYIF